MKLTGFGCASCGGPIPLNDLNNIATCPYCSRDFYVSEDWENKIKISTKDAERMLVKNIHDIKIPEVQEKVLRKDIEAFKKVNESIAFLENEKMHMSNSLNSNSIKLQDIENKVGHDYEELTSKTPKILGGDEKNFFALVIFAYIVSGIVAVVLMNNRQTLLDNHFGRSSTFGFFDFIAAIFVIALWIIFIGFAHGGMRDDLDRIGYQGSTLVFVPYLLFFAIIIVIPLIQVLNQQLFIRKLDKLKKNLDLKRIESRKFLLKENIRLSSEIELLENVIKELNKLKFSASILKATRQFYGLSSKDTLKKIDFALKRMRAAPIEFEIACTNFNPDNIDVIIPKSALRGDDANSLAQKALSHINS